jgi:L-glyceraldehyde 3-phosphate reductase
VTRGGSLREAFLTPDTLARVKALSGIAQRRGQSLAQMAIAWVLRDPRITSALIGARTVEQLEDSLSALDRLDFTPAELDEIDRHAVESGINLWQRSSTDAPRV